MKKFVFVMFVAALSTIGYAQSTDKGAKIKFVEEEIDYGTIEQGADGVRVFEFVNEGEEPLVISRVSSSCGCTVPSWTKEPIAAGEKGKIEVKYDTRRLGPIRKTVTVYSNDASTPQKGLKIKGTIVAKK